MRRVYFATECLYRAKIVLHKSITIALNTLTYSTDIYSFYNYTHSVYLYSIKRGYTNELSSRLLNWLCERLGIFLPINFDFFALCFVCFFSQITCCIWPGCRLHEYTGQSKEKRLGHAACTWVATTNSRKFQRLLQLRNLIHCKEGQGDEQYARNVYSYWEESAVCECLYLDTLVAVLSSHLVVL